MAFSLHYQCSAISFEPLHDTRKWGAQWYHFSFIEGSEDLKFWPRATQFMMAELGLGLLTAC